ncbi:hypothetical protein OV522_26600, partial [Salmonella enterica subsp. enterica serovar 1,4,[5],12:i:-]|nr:hypothetical protein [Salmonella enterica subsp. enterica serovar 1,4,[5],12:i:-]MCY5688460.1 hypothetical protein [Salmonella enterica subsp. enterica serovar 1,4,[5],12:i:-]
VLNPDRLRPIRMGSNFFICIPCCEAVFSADQFVKIIADSSRIRHCKKLALRAIRALIGTNLPQG